MKWSGFIVGSLWRAEIRYWHGKMEENWQEDLTVAIVRGCDGRELRLYLVIPGELCPVTSHIAMPQSKGNLDCDCHSPWL